MADGVELQKIHLNEITQFDFAEVIRQVAPVSMLGNIYISQFRLPGKSYKIPSWAT